jgi:hypothetical protein
MGIVDAFTVVLVAGGLAVLLINSITLRANARAERETDVEGRLARYAGANRS